MSNKVKYVSPQFIVDPSKTQILEESSIGFGISKIKMKVTLQEKDVVNNNRRSYDEEILKLIVAQLGPKATERKLLAELDHPIQQVDDIQEKLKRTATISLGRACLLFTKLEFDSKYIVAECETLTTEKGKILYSLIKDKVVFGFSLRALGSTKTMPNGIIKVLLDGFKAITFDVVSNPSHSNAVVTEFINESTFDGVISSLKTLRNSVNGIELTGSNLQAISENTTPELLESTYFIGNKVKYVSKDIGSEGLQVLLESEELGGVEMNSDKFSFGNTCISNIEEAISYFLNMKSQKIVGFKL